MDESNATMVKFGYPDLLLKSFSRWEVLLRPQQITLGAMVLVCREPVGAFSQISAEAFLELKNVTAEASACLKTAFAPDKLNFLMLMMVDPDVHFHLLPRYKNGRVFAGRNFVDQFWPKPVDLTIPCEPDKLFLTSLLRHLKESWAR